jgi:uncharacterized membrane protein
MWWRSWWILLVVVDVVLSDEVIERFLAETIGFPGEVFGIVGSVFFALVAVLWRVR